MSMEGLSPAESLAAIRREADRWRADGRIPAGFEEELAMVWSELAADPASLLEGATAERAPRRWLDAGTRGRGELHVISHRAERVIRAVSRRGRAVSGPKLRAARRLAGDLLGRAVEACATYWEVEIDRARFKVGTVPLLQRLAAHSPSARAFEPPRPAGRTELADDVVGWALEHVPRPEPGARAVHVESGGGEVLRRLSEAGFTVSGADPAARAGGAGPVAAGGVPPVATAGAIAYLGGLKRRTLAALVLSGVTDRLSPRTARAVVHLASTRLRPGGRLAVLSSRPAVVPEADPVRADLTVGRPLHPVTWCHLLARYGFSEVTVMDEGGAQYAVAAKRS